MRLDTFAAAVELDNALAARSLGEARLLRCALGEPRPLASPGQRGLRFVARAARAFLLLRRLLQLPPADVDLDIGRRQRFALTGLVEDQSRELIGNLGATPLRGLGCLPQLHQLQLEVMAAALLRRHRHAFGVILLLARFEIVFRGGAGGRRDFSVGARDDDGLRELGKLALARDHAVKLAVRRKKTDRVGTDDVSG